ncbi:MAG: SPOR domain-containing protein [Pseudomonadota bacterium]
MRPVSRRPAQVLAVVLTAWSGVAAQQEVNQNGQPIVVPSQSSVFNQNSVNLPNAPMTTGQDIVRGADGTSCQSAIASGGPYLDVGVLQSQDFYQRDSAAVYGRVVIPIGKRAKRLDCTKLYQLEIERMRMELELLRLGTTYTATPVGLQKKEDAPTEVEGFTIGGDKQPSRPQKRPAPAMTPVQPDGPMRQTRAVVTPEPKDPVSLVTLGHSRPTTYTPSGFYAQAGAFGSRESADLRLLDAVTSSGFGSGHIKPQVIGGQTLFRVMLGPTTQREARQLCRAIPGDCFVAEQTGPGA